jgi:hypothetical protein
MGTTVQARDLELAVAGDVQAFARLEAAPHGDLRAAAKRTTPLSVDSAAVGSILRRLRDGEITAAQAQRWSSFVRRGYVASRAHGPISPIEIDIDPDAEDAIVEAVSRLDEIGDSVDGAIEGNELTSLLRALDARESSLPVAPT